MLLEDGWAPGLELKAACLRDPSPCRWSLCPGAGEKNLLGARGGVSQRFSCLLASIHNKWKRESPIKEQWPSHCTTVEMPTDGLLYGPNVGWEVGVKWYIHLLRNAKKRPPSGLVPQSVVSPAKAVCGKGGLKEKRGCLTSVCSWRFLWPGSWPAVFPMAMAGGLTRVFPPDIRRLLSALR